MILPRRRIAMMASAMPPSVTSSSRIFIAIGVTDVIGSTPSTSTSPSCSTKARMALSSPRKALDLVLGDRNARQMRHAADGIGIDGH